MNANELRTPVIGIQCTVLAIFIVVALPHTYWTTAVFPLVIIGTLLTGGWAITRRNVAAR